MQSQRADQSSYNHKGVCYISFTLWSLAGYKNKFLYFMRAKINIFLEKYIIPLENDNKYLCLHAAKIIQGSA